MRNEQEPSYVSTAEMFKAIAHPMRVRIFSALGKARLGKMTVTQIYEALNLSQPETSRHLSIMKQCGILNLEKSGNMTYYFINSLNPVCKCLTDCICNIKMSNAQETR